MSLLAHIYARVGNIQSALALSGDAHERIQRTEQYIWLAELYRIDGEVRRAAGQPLTNVEDRFSEALHVSRQQGARLFELRAATSLARLWREQGKGFEARELLAPVLGGFTEGFDTPDLKASNALLAELST
jgi:predicted ATPase